MKFINILNRTVSNNCRCLRHPWMNVVVFVMALVIAAPVFAFGGGRQSSSASLWPRAFYGGVHSYGVYFGGEGQANIVFCEGNKCEMLKNTCSTIEYTACQDEASCQGLGTHFKWNAASNTCGCADGYRGAECSECYIGRLCDVSCGPGYTGNLCDTCAEGHTGPNCRDCKEGWAKGSVYPYWRCVQGAYCQTTDSQGNCLGWGDCGYQRDSSGDKIVGVPNARGNCAESSDQNVVCESTDQNGDCNEWVTCPTNVTVHDIVGIPNAFFACCEDGEMFCGRYKGDTCTAWDCGICSAVRPQFCHSAADCVSVGYAYYDPSYGCYNCQDTATSMRRDTGCPAEAPMCGVGNGVSATQEYGTQCYECAQILDHTVWHNLGTEETDRGCVAFDRYLCETQNGSVYGSCRKCINNQDDAMQAQANYGSAEFADLGCSKDSGLRFCQADYMGYGDVCGAGPTCSDVTCIYGTCNPETSTCDCVDGFAGKRCDQCDEMHTGDECDKCAEGYYVAAHQPVYDSPYMVVPRVICRPVSECSTFIVTDRTTGKRTCAGEGEVATGLLYCSDYDAQTGTCFAADMYQCDGGMSYCEERIDNMCIAPQCSACAVDNLAECDETTCSLLGFRFKYSEAEGCHCALGFAGAECDECDDAHEGENCMKCAEGYYMSAKPRCPNCAPICVDESGCSTFVIYDEGVEQRKCAPSCEEGMPVCIEYDDERHLCLYTACYACDDGVPYCSERDEHNVCLSENVGCTNCAVDNLGECDETTCSLLGFRFRYSEEGGCHCAPGFAGAECDECDDAHDGEDCMTCAEGYYMKASPRCPHCTPVCAAESGCSTFVVYDEAAGQRRCAPACDEGMPICIEYDEARHLCLDTECYTCDNGEPYCTERDENKVCLGVNANCTNCAADDLGECDATTCSLLGFRFAYTEEDGCRCARGFAGAECDDCDESHDGENCMDCAEGYYVIGRPRCPNCTPVCAKCSTFFVYDEDGDKSCASCSDGMPVCIEYDEAEQICLDTECYTCDNGTPYCTERDDNNVCLEANANCTNCAADDLGECDETTCALLGSRFKYSEEGGCHCANGFAGAECGECDEAHDGENCMGCADGYYPSPVQPRCAGCPKICLPEPECETFVVLEGRGYRRCASCDEGEPFCTERDADTDVCVNSSCCGGTISYEVGINGSDVCCPLGWGEDDCSECAAGYIGDDCDECDEGYTRVDSGACVKCNKYQELRSDGKCYPCAEGFHLKSPQPRCSGFSCPYHCVQDCSAECPEECTEEQCNAFEGHYTYNEESGCHCASGFTGDSCNECDDAHDGEGCMECAEGYYVKATPRCPNCPPVCAAESDCKTFIMFDEEQERKRCASCSEGMPVCVEYDEERHICLDTECHTCDDGTPYCTRRDENNVCLAVNANCTACKVDDLGSCDMPGCLALEGHFAYDAENGCGCVSGFTGATCNECDAAHDGEDCIRCAAGYFNPNAPEYVSFLRGFNDKTARPSCSPNSECESFVVTDSNGLKRCIGRSEACIPAYPFYCSEKNAAGECTHEDCCGGEIEHGTGLNGADVCLPCSRTNFGACNEEECAALGARYTWSIQTGCAEQPTLSQEDCLAQGSNYTYDEVDGCKCATGYTGEGCMDCADGYYVVSAGSCAPYSECSTSIVTNETTGIRTCASDQCANGIPYCSDVAYYWTSPITRFCRAHSCCENDVIINGTQPDACRTCEGNATAYCNRRNSTKDCEEYGCCDGQIHKNAGDNGADICEASACSKSDPSLCSSSAQCLALGSHFKWTTGVGCTCADGYTGAECSECYDSSLCTCETAGEKPYCVSRDSSGKCLIGGCCVGAVQDGTGANGADSCKSNDCSTYRPAYCSARDSATGYCISSGCCNLDGDRELKPKENNLAVCIDTYEETAYCATRVGGVCYSFGLCEGSVSVGAGANGADLCTP